jgi:hypothetical protein
MLQMGNIESENGGCASSEWFERQSPNPISAVQPRLAASSTSFNEAVNLQVSSSYEIESSSWG